MKIQANFSKVKIYFTKKTFTIELKPKIKNYKVIFYYKITSEIYLILLIISRYKFIMEKFFVVIQDMKKDTKIYNLYIGLNASKVKF